MRLRKFRVQAFRCIHDSGEIRVGDLAAFIGKNESGKTTILEGLTLLNKDEKIEELDLCDEMAEELKSEIKIVEGEFELVDNEIRAIKEKFPDIPEIQKIRIFRTQKNPMVQYDFAGVKISDSTNKALNSWENFVSKIEDFISIIPNHIRIQLDTSFLEQDMPTSKDYFNRSMSEFNNNIYLLASEEKQVISEWEKIYQGIENVYDELLKGTSERTALENFIQDKLHPRFVYFSDYKKIHGNINLGEYLNETRDEKKTRIDYVQEFDNAETVKNLFYLAELDAEKLTDAQDSPPKLIKLLNTASKRLTDRLNPAWKGDPILVDLRYNPGNIMSVVISDVHKDGTVTNTGLLNRRAEGFKWTFSFVVNFAAETQKSELKEAILLLDEP
ncbi:MAG: hypothetical protein YK1309IOTA_1270003, partial [Marine Group I thaumarchaeote]